MRKLVLTASLLAFGAGAGLAAGQFAVRGDLTWSVAKSPQTGRCFEIVESWDSTGWYLGYGYMGMAEVPCDEVGLE